MKDSTVSLAHGSGGTKTRELVELFKAFFENPVLDPLDDSAILHLDKFKGKTLAFTTDSYVVSPVFFAGGDIGKLSVTGTVNDLACLGAVPLYISAGFIIEEGFALAELEKIVSSMAEEARKCKVTIAAGDTKVVGRSQADKLFITTTGIGAVPKGVRLGANLIQPGDRIVLTGSLGDHTISIAIARDKLPFKTDLVSDCQALHNLVANAISVGKSSVHAIRDVTRGGLSTVLTELAQSSRVQMLIDEARIPVNDAVRGACRLLGYDVLHLANEGKMVIFVAEDDAEKVLFNIKKMKEAENAEIIGRVLSEEESSSIGMNSGSYIPRVVMRTRVGGLRIVEPPSGELLPRIC